MKNMADLNNPYAPPAAAVADIAPGEDADFQPVKIFGTRGRIGRMRYVTYVFSANFILGLAMQIIIFILGAMLDLRSRMPANGVGNAPPDGILGMAGAMGVVFWVVWAIIMVLILIFYVRISIQRAHDMNLSGWAVLWAFIPFVVLVWILSPGTQGHNRFGAPPPPNSTGVKVAFWICMGFMLFGILLLAIGAAMMRRFAG